MSPSFRRVIPFILLTLIYWPIALFLLALWGMGDCFPNDVGCEDARITALWWGFAAELALYALIFFVMLKRRTKL